MATKAKNKEKPPPERWTHILVQVAPSLLFAGFGMLFAGLLLNRVQTSVAFTSIRGIVILVPALLGLKGNLEMTMASRLSSIANLGLLSTPDQRQNAYRSNMALIQCQSIIVGCSAAVFSCLITLLSGKYIGWSDLLLLTTTSVSTASIASFLLAMTMMRIINWSLDHGINPDNVATPIAAALGDFATLAILQLVAIVCTQFNTVLHLLTLGVILRILPVFWKIASANEQTSVALREGWFPIITGMLLSSLGGSVLERALSRFPSIAVYQPLVNGVGGNLAAIATSRLSSQMHIAAIKDDKSPVSQLPKSCVQLNLNPIKFLLDGTDRANVNRILLSLVIPCQSLYVLILSFWQSGTLYNALICCLIASFFQVYILLFLVENVLVISQRLEMDPDNFGIPFLTAFGDLIGCTLLFICKSFV